MPNPYNKFIISYDLKDADPERYSYIEQEFKKKNYIKLTNTTWFIDGCLIDTKEKLLDFYMNSDLFKDKDRVLIVPAPDDYYIHEPDKFKRVMLRLSNY